MKLRFRPNPVPIVFGALVVAAVIAGDLSPWYVVSEVLQRFDRYAFLALALIVPVVAGLGLNFGIVIGAMAGQAALVAVTTFGLGEGFLGFLLACAIAVPIAVLLGILVGLLFNRARGKEMIAGLIAGFFANGIYQIVFLFCVGTIIPYRDVSRLVPRGEGIAYGLRNTFEMRDMQHALDGILKVNIPIGVIQITLSFGLWLVIGALCFTTWRFLGTKLGQELRAMGQDRRVAEIHGIRVDRNRILATVISTVLAAWGQMIYLQNYGKIDTYSSHELVGMWSVAALLIAGATAERATIWHALGGVLLVHALSVTLPLAGAHLLERSELGEYIRTALMYGVITIALALHAIRKRRHSSSGPPIPPPAPPG